MYSTLIARSPRCGRLFKSSICGNAGPPSGSRRTQSPRAMVEWLLTCSPARLAESTDFCYDVSAGSESIRFAHDPAPVPGSKRSIATTRQSMYPTTEIGGIWSTRPVGQVQQTRWFAAALSFVLSLGLYFRAGRTRQSPSRMTCTAPEGGCIVRLAEVVRPSRAPRNMVYERSGILSGR